MSVVSSVKPKRYEHCIFHAKYVCSSSLNTCMHTLNCECELMSTCTMYEGYMHV